jgi:hypothetical protein
MREMANPLGAQMIQWMGRNRSQKKAACKSGLSNSTWLIGAE